MKKLFILLIILLSGCATTIDQLKQNEYEKITSIKIVCYNTPGIQIHTGSTIVGGGLLFGGFGMEAIAEQKGKEMTANSNLPDFTSLIAKTFANNIRNEINNWPPMIVEEESAGTNFSSHIDTLLTFKTTMLWLYSFGALKGLNTVVEAKLTSPDGKQIWSQNYTYQQKKYGEVPELEIFAADKCKILKEQMGIAADKTVSGFINEIKKGLYQ